MKLWTLQPSYAVNGLRLEDNPWEPEDDKSFGFVIRAKNEAEAREIASKFGGDEKINCPDVWLNQKYSDCKELTPKGNAGLILQDYQNG